MHLIAKSLTRKGEEEIKFDSLHSTINNYGIHDWSEQRKLMYIEKKWIDVYNKCGIGNIYLDENCNIVIDGNLSKNEFKEFAKKQYDYSMTEGLISHSSSSGWHKRDKSDFIERIFWHYITSIYTAPQISSCPEGECFLDGLFTDLTEKMEKERITARGFQIWKKEDTSNGLDMLRIWERSFISKNILCPIDFGDKTYIAPSFFSELDYNVLNGIDSYEIIEFLKKLNKISSYPISKGNTELYNLAKSLQRAGAIKLVDDPYRSPGASSYAYAVPRKLFKCVETKLDYSYSTNPLPEWGDSSITDQFFVAIGRVNTYGYNMAPGLMIFPEDTKGNIDKVINDLADKYEADISNLPNNVLNPLKTINLIYDENGKLVVNPQNEQFIDIFSDIWHNLYNEPELQQIDFPSVETASNNEARQIEYQIKKANKHIFG